MPRDGSGVLSAPAGTTATAGTTIESAKYNAFVADWVSDGNTARPIVAGGTGATTAGAALSNLGGQPSDAALTSIASLSWVADRYPYTTGADAFAMGTITAAGRAILGDADAAAQRSTLGLVIGTNVQAYDAALASLAGLSLAAGDILYATGADTVARLAIGADGTFLGVSGGALAYGTAGATRIAGVALSGTVTTLTTAIPSTANRVDVGFVAVSTNGTAEPAIRVGAGSLLTSGYDAAAYMAAIGNQTETDGFTIFPGTAAASAYTGHLTLTRHDTDLWFASGWCKRDSDGVMAMIGGTISVTGGINRVGISGKGDTFDGGTGYVTWSL